jgi:hypothetical protein
MISDEFRSALAEALILLAPQIITAFILAVTSRRMPDR